MLKYQVKLYKSVHYIFLNYYRYGENHRIGGYSEIFVSRITTSTGRYAYEYGRLVSES